MEANQNKERIYELLEQFDFSDLSKADRLFILSEMSENEYNSLRNTISGAILLFEASEELNIEDTFCKALLNGKKQNSLLKFLKRPVQLYKLAASIIVIIGIFSILHYTEIQGKNEIKMSSDTIYIYKTDTVYSKIVDTVRFIKEKIVYVAKNKESDTTIRLLSAAKNENDYSIRNFHNDIDRTKVQVYKDSIMRDTLFNN
jgi:hypothetical protein